MAGVYGPGGVGPTVRRKEKGEEGDDVITTRVASFASWPAPVDWDGGGDLDLLIGTLDGDVHLRANAGTRKEPNYAAASPQVMCGAEPLKVAMHAAPVVADWNGDGKWDLVVGSGDGSVWFFANRGSKEGPELAAGVTLVPRRAKSKSLRQILLPGDGQQPGVRAQTASSTSTSTASSTCWSATTWTSSLRARTSRRNNEPSSSTPIARRSA